MIFDEEILFTYIGYAAGLATFLTFAFQAFRILKSKSVTNLSAYMYIICNLGLICWFAYGIYINSMILVISNLAAFICTFIILLMILYYDEEDKVERARRDALTWVFNRKYFEATVPMFLSQAEENKQGFVIMLLDLCNLDDIRQQFGHKVSDNALKILAKYLEKALRNNDMVARFDENIFAIFLENSDDKKATIVAHRLSDNAGKLTVKINKKQDAILSTNIGICSSTHASDLETLCKNAQTALNKADKAGENKIEVYKKKSSSNKESKK